MLTVKTAVPITRRIVAVRSVRSGRMHALDQVALRFPIPVRILLSRPHAAGGQIAAPPYAAFNAQMRPTRFGNLERHGLYGSTITQTQSSGFV